MEWNKKIYFQCLGDFDYKNFVADKCHPLK